jgi:FlaA1/EpsC-like NDP-sugar epimerase
MKRSQLSLVLVQVIFDILFTVLAVGLAYRINLARDPSVGEMGQYLAQMAIYVVTVIGASFVNKLYTRSRGQPRLEELLALLKAVTVGSLLAIAFISFLLKNIIDYRRPMLVLAWLLTLLLLTFSRVLHIRLQRWLMRRGVGNSDVLVVGTGEVARMVLQKMLNSPQLGYRPVGLVAVDDGCLSQTIEILDRALEARMPLLLLLHL